MKQKIFTVVFSLSLALGSLFIFVSCSEGSDGPEEPRNDNDQETEVKGLEAEILQQIALFNSYAFRVEFGDDVCFYYEGCYGEKAEKYSDDVMCRLLEQDHSMQEATESIIVLEGEGSEGDTIYHCILTFDGSMQNKKLYRNKIVLPHLPEEYPYVSIDDVKCDMAWDEGYGDMIPQWFWTTTPEGGADEYYQLLCMSDAVEASKTWTDARMALAFVGMSNSLNKTENWQWSAFSDKMVIAIAKKNGEWSPILNKQYLPRYQY